MKISFQKILLISFLLFAKIIFAQEEKILNFHVDIIINADRTINVTENIKVYANGDQIVRGIYRKIPETRTDKNGKTFRNNIHLESVKHNGLDSKYIEEDSDNFSLKIGERDVLIPSGIHDYEIKYTIKGQIGFYDNYDELYWNVTGTEWDFSIEKASATLILPTYASDIQSSCYTGYLGATTDNCNYKVEGGNEIYFETQNLQVNEGLTVAIGFPKGIVNPPPPPTFSEKYGVIFLFVASFFGLFGLMYVSWKKFGKDPQKPAVFPQFFPPENLSPAAVNMIINDSYDESSITYSIVNLATKGYLKITDTSKKVLGIFTSKSFELEKLKESDNNIAIEEQSIFNCFFKENKKIKFTGSYNSNIGAAFRKHALRLNKKYDTLLNQNSKGILLPVLIYILSVFIGSLCYAEYVIIPAFVSIFITIGLFLMAVFFKLFFILFKSRVTYSAILRASSIIMGCLVIIGLVLYKNDLSLGLIVATIYITVSTIAIVFFQYLIKQPSVEKLRVQSLVEGFKMYIEAAETNRLKFSNPPAMTPSHFEMILPYAMAFGVDEIWGEKFATILSNSSQEYQSTWYVGTHPFEANSMRDFSSSFTSTANSSSTKPSKSSSSSSSSSSSGSWSSGSSGGGSSGGGGGGGGGGGW